MKTLQWNYSACGK